MAFKYIAGDHSLIGHVCYLFQLTFFHSTNGNYILLLKNCSNLRTYYFSQFLFTNYFCKLEVIERESLRQT
ncbi:hypothetical protein EVA_05812 [gut metagenome]|uniref:Uncharacterized protein n=1 Tax=gut metagenome TaxID=749906 RepID=J9D0K7_9ZZZZ